MASTLPRSTLKWVLSLNLSLPMKNVRRDFANGFLVAEMLSRYFPEDIQMHSFENVASMERKKAQWALIQKVFKRRKAPVTAEQVQRTMSAEADAAEDLLETLYRWLAQDSGGSVSSNSSNNNNRPTPQGVGQQAAGVASSGAGQAHTVAYLHGAGQQAAGYAGMHPAYMQAAYGAAGQVAAHAGAPNGFVFGGVPPKEAAYHGGGRQDSALARANIEPSAQPEASGQQVGLSWNVDPQQQRQGGASAHVAAQQSEMVQAQQAYYAYQAQLAEAQAQMNAYGSNAYGYQNSGPDPQAYYNAYYALYAPGAAPSQMYGYPQYGAVADAAEGSTREEGLAYSKQPRCVEYTPYTMEDFKSKPYNSKEQKYWELGKMGPDLETDELREKREKAERMKQYAKDAHKKNMAVSASKPAKGKANSAATKPVSSRERALDFAKNIPKPEMKIKKVVEEEEAASGNSAGGRTELDELEAQHRLDQQRIDEIRRELGKIGF